MQEILDQLPYTSPFLFVDRILNVGEDHIEGIFTFSPDLYFYKGHFKDNPVTPGVILTECMAQIGVVCLGIFLSTLKTSTESSTRIALTSTDVEFIKPVFPGETVRVVSEKQYFRFQKLKCRVAMHNERNEMVASGIIAGMIIRNKNNQ